MKIIIGLGNPEKKYFHNRHNVGFILLDRFVKELGGEWRENQKFNALISKIGDYILVKPLTFINNSGESVSKIVSFYKLEVTDILVVHDDIDLAFGKIKKVFDSSSAGHHGVESIIEKFGTNKFHRLRIGVGKPENKDMVNNHVLGNFNEEELEFLKKIDLKEYL